MNSIGWVLSHECFGRDAQIHYLSTNTIKIRCLSSWKLLSFQYFNPFGSDFICIYHPQKNQFVAISYMSNIIFFTKLMLTAEI